MVDAFARIKSDLEDTFAGDRMPHMDCFFIVRRNAVRVGIQNDAFCELLMPKIRRMLAVVELESDVVFVLAREDFVVVCFHEQFAHDVDVFAVTSFVLHF